jgi:hypothetical protein
MADYIWPISKSTTPDEMNTSFGPRINRDKWDFHDGIDVPAPIGTPVYALRDGLVHRAGPGGTEGFSSRHIVLEVNDPNDGLIYLVYVHLDSIDEAITRGASVTQGQLLATVGDDDATYPHLHIEFRKGTPRQIGSVHPLSYLPYIDTANFSPPVLDRFNRLSGLMAARLLFGANSKLEGDLKRVEVDLKSGPTLLDTRVVDFNDKNTVIEANSDDSIFVDDIGVEGYQKSDMIAHQRADLNYGILIRDIPSNCDRLVARVKDVSNNIATSPEIAVPTQTAVDKSVAFEDGQMPPPGWQVVTSASGSGTTVTNVTASGHTGSLSRLMLSTDASATETSTQRAGIEYTLPAGRFEWTAEAWFNPLELNLASGQSVYLLHFLSGANLSVAARIHHRAGSFRAEIIVKKPDGTLKDEDSAANIDTGAWRKWRLHLLRIGTRETTAILYLNEGGKLEEQARINWDSTTYEPLSLRVGIGLSSAGATATVLTDKVRVTESQLS